MLEHNEIRRKELYSLLGNLPRRHKAVTAEVIDSETNDGFLLERLELELNGLEPVPALFVKPTEGDEAFPAILYNHAHGGDYSLGKEELLLGRSFMSEPPYARELTSQGYAALCIDAWGFGERHTKSESGLFKELLWHGRCLWGMMVFDSLRALEYLHSREDVATQRIATLGMSMGSTMAWWLAALDTRVKVCVDICCLTDFHTLLKSGNLDLHGLYYYVPDLLNHFSTAEINELIAPRPHLSLAGRHDPLTPPEGLNIIDTHLQNVYKDLGYKDNWKMMIYDTNHHEELEMRRACIEFLDARL